MITIRKSQEADRQIIEQLAVASAEAIHLDKKLERMIKTIGQVELLVAEVDGQLGGFMYAYFKAPGDMPQAGNDELHISAIVVHPDHRRQGVASSLIQSIMGKTDKPITTHIDIDNTKAISLFASLGFKIIHTDAERVTMEFKVSE